MVFMLIISDHGRSIICEIYNKNYKRMIYTATQILGREGGEEAVHDVFAKLIEKFENNAEDLADKPGQFFVIVVRNHSLNLLKKGRLELLPFEDDFIGGALSHPPVHNPEEILLNEEAVEALASLIRRLSPATRQALEYKYIEGYSNTEISEMLNISESAVSTRISKARKRLKEMLESEGTANEAN